MSHPVDYACPVGLCKLGAAAGVNGPDDRAVDRHLVHRRSVAEVFVTAIEADGAQVVVRAQWPRANRFHLSADGHSYDELLVVETFRQAVISSAHLVHHVPPDRHFVMNRVVLELGPGAPKVIGTPADVVLRLRRQTLRRPTSGAAAGRLFREEVHAEISCDGIPVGIGRAELTVLDGTYYARLRGTRGLGGVSRLPNSEIPARQVGRHFSEDVLLAGDQSGPGGLMLRVHPQHPVYFDHPQDHVPGLALIDAARQAALLDRPGCRLRQLDVEFCRFVELDRPCAIVTTWAASRPDAQDGSLETSFVQAGVVRTIARMTMARS